MRTRGSCDAASFQITLAFLDYDLIYARLALADLRTEVVRRADHGVRLVLGARQNSRDSEVADLQYVVRRHEHVRRLQVCTPTARAAWAAPGF